MEEWATNQSENTWAIPPAVPAVRSFIVFDIVRLWLQA